MLTFLLFVSAKPEVSVTGVVRKGSIMSGNTSRGTSKAQQPPPSGGNGPELKTRQEVTLDHV